MRLTFENRDSPRSASLKRKRMFDQPSEKSSKTARLSGSADTGAEARNDLAHGRSTARQDVDVEMGDGTSRVAVAAVAQGVSDMTISPPQSQ